MLVACAGILAAIGSPAFATNLYVDALHGNDATGNGSLAAPWRTITRAHAAAPVAGDRILVAPGVYDAALGESFPITLRAAVPVIGSGADRTFVRGTPGVTTALFAPGGGQTWFRLTDLALSRSEIAVAQIGPGGADTFLLLERLVVENNEVGVKVSDGPGIFLQCALQNCLVRGNDVGVWVDAAWSGFAGVYAFLYGCTLSDNATALRGTTVFGNPPNLLLQHSIVKKNGDDLFAADFGFLAPVHGCLVSESSLVGSNGNSGAAPGFVNYAGHDPHLRSDSPARNLVAAGATHWPPAPAPGVPQPSWWGVSFQPSFAEVADIDGRAREDGLIDAGCDEFESPFVSAWGAPAPGGSIDLVLHGDSPIALYAALGASAGIPTPYGTWGLAVPFFYLATFAPDAQGNFVAPAPLPPDAGLIGLDLYLQSHTTLPPIAIAPVEWLRILP